MFLFKRYHLLAAEWVDPASFWSLSKSLEEDLALCCILKTTWKARASVRLILEMDLEVRIPSTYFLFASQMAGYRQPLWQWTLEATKSKCDKKCLQFIDCTVSLYKQRIKVFENNCVREGVAHLDIVCSKCCSLESEMPQGWCKPKYFQ